MDKKIVDTIDNIAKCYLSNDPIERITSKATRNIEVPFKNLYNDISTLFTREEIMGTRETKSNKEYTIMRIDHLETKHNEKSYLYSSFDGKPYDFGVSIKISIIKKTISQNEEIINVVSSSEFPEQEIRIPEYIPSSYNNPGGYFIVNKGISKFVTMRMEQTYVWPKFKKKMQTNNTYHISIISRKPTFELINEKLYPPQFLTIDISIIPDKIKCVINSQNSFIPIDTILLIHYLTSFNFDVISMILKSKFENHIQNIIGVLVQNAVNIIEKTTIEQYIDDIVASKYNKSAIKKTKTLSDYKNQIFNNFLPHMEKCNKITKGLYLTNILRQFFVAIYQPDVYPDKDNISTRRISTAADIFENIIKSAVDTAFKQSWDDFKSLDLNKTIIQSKIVPQITTAFNNFFNMQDSKNSNVVKLATRSNWHESIIVSNAVIRGTSIELTKSLEARNLHESTIGILDIYDTPDGGVNTGLVKRLAIGITVTHHTIDVRRKIFNQIYDFINSKVSNNDIDYINGVPISIVDESDHYIKSIKEELANDFISKFKKVKRDGIFIVNDVCIEAVPIHVKDPIKQINMPINKYLLIRINVGNKRVIQPMFIVENGNLNLLKYIKDLETESYESFALLIKKYPDIIEYLDAAQCLYSNICNEYELFIKMPHEQKIKYEYVRFPSYLSFSYLTSCLYDIGKLVGVRGTFGVAQQKQVVSGPLDNVFNTFDSCNFLAFPIERPIITNVALELSGIARNSIGTHLLTGLFSWNLNVEDGLIINRKSIEMGKLSVITMIPIKAEISDIQINRNNPSLENTNNDYRKITHTGLPAVGSVLVNKNDNKDALYKCLKPMFRDNDDTDYLFDQSEGYPHVYPGYVERIRKLGTDIIKIDELISSYRKLSVGDKLTTRAAQKGTIAKILDPKDIPYLETGERPDIIFNSTSIVGRKTISMYMEAILTNKFCELPYDENNQVKFINYPTFTSTPTSYILQNIIDELKKIYPEKNDQEIYDLATCRKTIYNPYTHEPIQIKDENNKIATKAFVSPILFCRLAQMSADKISARNRGRLDKLLQPPSGKKKGGGIKVGEMEVDVLSAHGAVNTLYELMSDTVEKRIPGKMCYNCGIFATYESNRFYSRWKCSHCDNLGLSPKIIDLNITYATKIMLMLLNSRSISVIPVETKEDIYYPSYD